MNDEQFMQLALNLAKSAEGHTNPNPLVGAVLVKDGMIVGTGLHRKAGEPHAEVHAFRMAGEHAKGATLYVTLEPCSHFGKTPPCANLVKESGVKRVVVAMQDPNPSVAGRGIALIRDAGIEVKVGVLEEEAQRLNERFVHNMLTERPFVVSKYAMTLDGKIATATGHSKWITSEAARADVHRVRDRMDGILVGVGTVLADDPKLTARLADREGKHPTRIILDRSLRTPLSAHVANTNEAPTIIVTEVTDEEKLAPFKEFGVQFIHADLNDLQNVLKQLYRHGITDILVEGGGEVNGSFLRANVIDKFIVYIAPKVLGGRHSISPFTGVDVSFMDEAMALSFHEVEMVGPDLKVTAYPKKEV